MRVLSVCYLWFFEGDYFECLWIQSSLLCSFIFLSWAVGQWILTILREGSCQSQQRIHAFPSPELWAVIVYYYLKQQSKIKEAPHRLTNINQTKETPLFCWSLQCRTTEWAFAFPAAESIIVILAFQNPFSKFLPEVELAAHSMSCQRGPCPPGCPPSLSFRPGKNSRGNFKNAPCLRNWS